MGYPIFGKIKTIVLPWEGGAYSGKKYFEKYGIDLTEIFHKSGSIDFKLKSSFRDALFLIKYQVNTGLMPIYFTNEQVEQHIHTISVYSIDKNGVLDVFHLIWDDTKTFNLENITLEEA